jgi:hypothetical protein
VGINLTTVNTGKNAVLKLWNIILKDIIYFNAETMEVTKIVWAKA